MKRHKRAFGECCSSDTVDKLLELVGRGQAHVSTATEVARAVVSDAPHKPTSGIHCLAKCGNFGKRDNNAERDMLTWTRGCYGLELEPYTVELVLQAF